MKDEVHFLRLQCCKHSNPARRKTNIGHWSKTVQNGPKSVKSAHKKIRNSSTLRNPSARFNTTSWLAKSWRKNPEERTVQNSTTMYQFQRKKRLNRNGKRNFASPSRCMKSCSVLVSRIPGNVSPKNFLCFSLVFFNSGKTYTKHTYTHSHIILHSLVVSKSVLEVCRVCPTLANQRTRAVKTDLLKANRIAPTVALTARTLQIAGLLGCPSSYESSISLGDS